MRRVVEVRRGAYRDSVTLMQVSQAAAGEPGVDATLVAMATDLNVDLLAGMGFALTEPAGPNDMLVAVAATDDDALVAARHGSSASCRRGRSATDPGARTTTPRTVGSAVRSSGAGLVLVSYARPYRLRRRRRRTRRGRARNAVQRQRARRGGGGLKTEADRRGLLVMGPDCGTVRWWAASASASRTWSVPVRWASSPPRNRSPAGAGAARRGRRRRVPLPRRGRPGPVHRRRRPVDPRALDPLADDDGTEVIVLVSKPPAPDVADRVRAHADGLGKPVVYGLLGRGQPDLTATARRVVEAAGTVAGRHLARGRRLGTASTDTCVALRRRHAVRRGDGARAESLGPIRSNIPSSRGGSSGPTNRPTVTSCSTSATTR